MSTTSVALPPPQQQQQPQQQCIVNRAPSKTQSAEDGSHSSQESTAPPLPPRKSASGRNDSNCEIADNLVNRMLKPSTAPNHGNQLASTNTTSSENITTCELDVPQTEAPPIPKHNTVKANHVDQTFEDDLKHIHLSHEDNGEKIIVGPAETISGIIDTRPIEARKPLATTNMSVTSTDKETILVTPNGANNVYHLKIGGNGQQQTIQSEPIKQQTHMQKHPSSQTRHQSFPSNSSSGQSAASSVHPSMPSKSQTTPHFGLEYVKLNTTTTPASIATAATSSRSNANISHTNNDDSGTSCNRRDGSQSQQPLLYENITINNKDCNVPYENINLEYIARLMNEGYSKENVITALGISRNNIEMACDILHEFVSKSSVWIEFGKRYCQERFAHSMVQWILFIYFLVKRKGNEILNPIAI